MAEDKKQTIEEMFETIEGTIAELEKDIYLAVQIKV